MASHAGGDTVPDGPVNHLQRQLGLGLEGDVGGDAGLAAASLVVGQPSSYGHSTSLLADGRVLLSGGVGQT